LRALGQEVLEVQHLMIEEVPQRVGCDLRVVEQAADRDHPVRLVEGGEHGAARGLRPGNGRGSHRRVELLAGHLGQERGQVVVAARGGSGAPARALGAYLERALARAGVGHPPRVGRIRPPGRAPAQHAPGQDERDGRLLLRRVEPHIVAEAHDEPTVGRAPGRRLEGRVAPVGDIHAFGGEVELARHLPGKLRQERRALGGRRTRPRAQRKLHLHRALPRRARPRAARINVARGAAWARRAAPGRGRPFRAPRLPNRLAPARVHVK
jgi:hypothetical protein